MIKLNKWKHSKKRKERKIYGKAKRLIARSQETEEVTEDKIEEMRIRFPTLNMRLLSGGLVAVRSEKDGWLIQNEGRYFALFHADKYAYLGKNREGYHIQDVFHELEYTLASIVSHDRYKISNISYSLADVSRMAFS